MAGRGWVDGHSKQVRKEQRRQCTIDRQERQELKSQGMARACNFGASGFVGGNCMGLDVIGMG